MAKAKKTFKLSELTCTIPDSGQYPESETGTDGTVYVGLPPYEYSGLKGSLEDKGYVPEEFDYIAADVDGNVFYGGFELCPFSCKRFFSWLRDIFCNFFKLFTN